MDEPTNPEPSIVQAALGGLCPRCGGRGIFKGLIAVNFRCRVCGFDLSRIDIGDGAALALVGVLTLLFSGVAILVEMTHAPDYLVHVLLWPSLLIGVSIVLIRILKAGLIAIGYAYHRGKIKL